MKAAVISGNSVSSKWIIKAMEEYFDDVDSISIKDLEINLGTKNKLDVLHKGKPIAKYDCVYVRGSFRYSPLLRSLTLALYKKCYMPIKADAFTIGHDKLLTQLQLEEQGIPMPKTYISATAKAAKELLGKLNFPIIMKFPQGTQGKGVMYADSFAAASSILDALTTLKQPFIIQEYIESGSTDTRAIVVGEKVVACMKRKAIDGEKRSNIHIGATGETCILDGHTRKIAVSAAKALGAEICGVDVLDSAKGPLVIEINLSPGLQGIMSATKIDIPDDIARYLYKKTKEFVESKKKTGSDKIMQDIDTNGVKKEIITTLDFRGERILLPEIITDIAKFDNKEEYILKAEKGKVSIKPLGVKNED